MRYFDQRAEKIYSDFQQHFNLSDEMWALLNECKEAIKRMDSDAEQNTPWRKDFFKLLTWPLTSD